MAAATPLADRLSLADTSLLRFLEVYEVATLIAVEHDGLTPADRVRRLVRDYLALNTGDPRFDDPPLREVRR